MNQKLVCHEDELKWNRMSDRRGKNLIGTKDIPATSGFCIGVAEYDAAEFGERQTHNDQEAVYVISGVGEMMIGDKLYPLRPGVAVYVPPNTVHCTRRTGAEAVKMLYTHGAI